MNGLLFCMLAFLVLPAAAQTTSASVKLPLPIDGPSEASRFEVPGPTATVLTGLLWPASGPLTAWAPVFSTFEADGTLKESQTGSWVGPRPGHWLKVVKSGFVVGGFRFLVKTSPGTPQTRQLQVFWKPWSDGETRGGIVESAVYGEAAGRLDQVRIIEIRLPDGATPTGLWGETFGGAVVQTSLLVRLASKASTKPPVAGSAPSKLIPPEGPSIPVVGPVSPVAPPSPF